MSRAIVLYDGVCGLCNWLVQFILRRDRSEVFCFATLQGPFAAKILAKHGENPAVLDTFYVVLNKDQAVESILARSDAVIFILRQLGGFWRLTGLVFATLPRPVRDFAYALVARNRYRIFGRYDTCPVPNSRQRRRFLDP